MVQNKLRALLTDLVKQLIESQQQYETIAKEAKKMRFKRLFESITNDRTFLLVDLIEEIKLLDGKIPYRKENKGLPGYSQRILSSENHFAVLQECLANESFLLHKYSELLEQDLPLEIRDLLNTHCKMIKRKYADMRQLSETFGGVEV